MAKFRGEVGYGINTEVRPGVWKLLITERKYSGDLLRTSRSLEEDNKVNKDISVSNSVSVVADAFANANFSAIQYVKWAGTRWTVPEVTVQSPRLILRMGGVYNGPGPEGSGTPDTP